MPMAEGTDRKTTEANFHEFRHGKTYKKTRGKFGKEKARKQMIAAVLSNKRKSAKKKRSKHRSSGR